MSRLEETVNDAEIIIEAVVDDLQVKQDLFESVYLHVNVYHGCG